MVLSEVELAVTCRLAKEETWNYGIIRGILPPRNEDDRTRRVNNMKEKMAIKGTQVREIIWIKKKIYNEERSSYEVKETNSVRLDFINDIPDKVFIGIMSYSVEPYTSEVTQCFRCQSFGHVAKHCKGPMKCVNCGRIGHKKTDCRASRPRCANCSEPHKSWSKQCPHYLKEVEALKIRSTTRTSIHTARNLAEESFPVMKRKNNDTTPQANHEEGPRPLYAHITRQQEQRQREPTQRRQRREPTQSRPTHRETNRRNVKQSQTIEVDPKKYVKQVIKAILPQILEPLVQIIIEVITIPGESSAKIERVKKVMQETIEKHV